MPEMGMEGDMMAGFNPQCPNCSKTMFVNELHCEHCGVKLQGKMKFPPLMRLSKDDQEFIEMFVLAGGSLKEIGRQLELSYPTVRGMLDQIIKRVRSMREREEKERLSVLEMLEEGKITAADAVELLKQVGDNAKQMPKAKNNKETL